MDKKLTTKLWEKYPSLFRDKDLSTMKTRIQTINCGDGWFDILDRMCQKIIQIDPDYKFFQIKQKFSLLRVYGDCSDDKFSDEIDEIIKYAVQESHWTCERCSSKDKVIRFSNTYGWVSMYCEKCRIEVEKQESE